VTIPTTNRATTETPANTPKPIGNTSNFFPGGSKGAAPAFSEVAVGLGEGGEGGGEVVVDKSGLGGCGLPGCGPPGCGCGVPGCGVAAGFGTEEIPITTTGGVLVTVGFGETVGDGISVLDPGGGKAPGMLPLPLSGVSIQVVSSLTISAPSTVVGLRVILHVRRNVPTPVVILSVWVTVTGDVSLVSCLGNTVDVCEEGEG